MSLVNEIVLKDRDELSTEQLNSSIMTSNLSIQSKELYEESFTLMKKLDSPHKNQLVSEPDPCLEKCLAYKITQRFPQGIRQEATKIVKYYESSLQSQIKEYHKLVETNNKLKKQNDRLLAQNLINKAVPFSDKQNQHSTQKTPLTPTKTPQKINYRKRIEELEDKVILRDKKINLLNTQVNDLTLKLRKYKKRLDTTGIKQ